MFAHQIISGQLDVINPDRTCVTCQRWSCTCTLHSRNNASTCLFCKQSLVARYITSLAIWSCSLYVTIFGLDPQVVFFLKCTVCLQFRVWSSSLSIFVYSKLFLSPLLSFRYKVLWSSVFSYIRPSRTKLRMQSEICLKFTS